MTNPSADIDYGADLLTVARYRLGSLLVGCDRSDPDDDDDLFSIYLPNLAAAQNQR